jgi:uncharacterized protein YcfL
MDTKRLIRSIRGAGPLFLASLVLCLAVSGCGTTSGIQGKGTIRPPAPEEEIPLNTQVTVNNTSLARDIAVTDMKSAFSGEILQAAATVTSMTSSTLTLQYKFVWYDAKDWEIEPESGTWKPLVLYGKDVKQIQGVAPNTAAKAFKIKIRR